jgi:hypothetical protein
MAFIHVVCPLHCTSRPELLRAALWVSWCPVVVGSGAHFSPDQHDMGTGGTLGPHTAWQVGWGWWCCHQQEHLVPDMYVIPVAVHPSVCSLLCSSEPLHFRPGVYGEGYI